MSSSQPTNRQIADTLVQIANLLEQHEGNEHRVRAYRSAAEVLRGEESSVAQRALSGIAELTALPRVGKGIAGAVRELVQTGRIQLLDQLRAETAPEDVLMQVPGIGSELAKRIHGELGITTLQELELAAHDGRLEQMEGVGPRRAEAVRESLASILSRSGRRYRRQLEDLVHGNEEQAREPKAPPVEMLLDVDREYREKARAGKLRTIAPKRFNPSGEAWLPILRTSRGEWRMTALYSNTARAHELNKTEDWVVIYYEQEGTEGQNTVVTRQSGSLKGERVVRGRERECRALYAAVD